MDQSKCPGCGAVSDGWGDHSTDQECIRSLRQQLAALTLRVEALEEREVGEFDDLVQKSDADRTV